MLAQVRHAAQRTFSRVERKESFIASSQQMGPFDWQGQARNERWREESREEVSLQKLKDFVIIEH